jgi:hypothetical protein
MDKKEIINIGNLKGTHKGWSVYGGGGSLATITSTDFKHNKMVLVYDKTVQQLHHHR